MHWRQRARQRQQEQLEASLRAFLWETLLPQLEVRQRALLLEALTPVAVAMRRLDQRQAETKLLMEAGQEETKALLIEVLQAQMPPLQERIFQDLGQLSLPPSSHSSAS
jgi:hypothetical protein